VDVKNAQWGSTQHTRIALGTIITNSTRNNSTRNNSTRNNSTRNNSTRNNSTPNNSTRNNSTPNNSTPITLNNLDTTQLDTILRNQSRIKTQTHITIPATQEIPTATQRLGKISAIA